MRKFAARPSHGANYCGSGRAVKLLKPLHEAPAMPLPKLDPAQYDAQLAEKTARLVELLAPFDAPAPEVFDSPREHSRLRTEFRLWREEGPAPLRDVRAGRQAQGDSD